MFIGCFGYLVVFIECLGGVFGVSGVFNGALNGVFTRIFILGFIGGS